MLASGKRKWLKDCKDAPAAPYVHINISRPIKQYLLVASLMFPVTALVFDLWLSPFAA